MDYQEVYEKIFQDHQVTNKLDIWPCGKSGYLFFSVSDCSLYLRDGNKLNICLARDLPAILLAGVEEYSSDLYWGDTIFGLDIDEITNDFINGLYNYYFNLTHINLDIETHLIEEWLYVLKQADLWIPKKPHTIRFPFIFYRIGNLIRVTAFDWKGYQQEEIRAMREGSLFIPYRINDVKDFKFVSLNTLDRVDLWLDQDLEYCDSLLFANKACCLHEEFAGDGAFLTAGIVPALMAIAYLKETHQRIKDIEWFEIDGVQGYLDYLDTLYDPNYPDTYKANDEIYQDYHFCNNLKIIFDEYISCVEKNLLDIQTKSSEAPLLADTPEKQKLMLRQMMLQFATFFHNLNQHVLPLLVNDDNVTKLLSIEEKYIDYLYSTFDTNAPDMVEMIDDSWFSMFSHFLRIPRFKWKSSLFDIDSLPVNPSTSQINTSLPYKNDYKDLIRWLESEKQQGRDYLADARQNRTAMCRNISSIVGWVVDSNSLGKRINKAKRTKKDKK